MSEMEAIKIDAYEIRQAELERLIKSLQDSIESWGLQIEDEECRQAFEDELKLKVDKWLKNLPWVVNWNCLSWQD